ncbi:DUF4397 domain-containing protein [Mucilaginibacter myungsuensis]|uniref:DUF4397 domain-containing protein n=1 Tax=Mucilaginibacter myungsuensis TaxID=649104 RepID=A0A929PYA7_9SPHI|nr:DUF4397 domain-containing protein [Mucilaginibacter myungsuensis]MBE9664041.1 DUF4397 domain-containing protein [Mucilaginibacter myungsuensis]MDN3601220.1 DUF4397 domain-containing protein [Mucilaginibacter myungsuensis]
MKTLTNRSSIKYLFLFLAATVTALSSCKKDDQAGNSTPTQAVISITNAVEGSLGQDFYVGDVKLNTSAIAYAQNTGYLSTNTGDKTAKFTNTGTTTANAQFSLKLEAGQYYSVFYTGGASASSSSYLVLTDEGVKPAADKIKVRFVNLTTGLASALDLGISATNKLATNIAAKTASAYYTLDATTQFNLYANASLDALLSIPVTTRPGSVYTIYVTGSSTTNLKLHLINQL